MATSETSPSSLVNRTWFECYVIAYVLEALFFRLRIDIKASDLAVNMNVRADQKCTGHIPLCLTSSAGFALLQNVHCDDVHGRRFHVLIKRQ